MTVATRTGAAAIVALAALQVAWHGWLAPPETVAPWLMAAVFVAPMLPALALLHRNNGRSASPRRCCRRY